MRVYKSRYKKLSGSSLEELTKLARKQYHTIQKRTLRRAPYVRSKYFTKDKIFINSFWEHMNQKSPKERVKRLKYYQCAIDLIRNTSLSPDTVYTYTNMNVGLHRFYGQTKAGEYFCVQISENKRTHRKEFMSVFPSKKPVNKGK